ncbi:hypothetical protein GV794_12895 [Nocardia cyriacigeorgica]|uniref:DUF8020 domain-containing protein n=1 Tax=Nocardia cyriacigeorgica TaxID=135487 RepID=A0A6P1D0K0_9NOCA|nr:hypothetical protein [Nocardia cyriacigeorgica]NEW39581.1 hypothetical protein [Nocardia cyriacigeorgica]NEW43995.1 hypothetical protein [Nocardia cyriacigeorgica]NEW50070.1 hypothetical protein [Nocardia cyriacigeorgica]NEW56543.1 hypothetical protein [Nocardia cyriacigeorgica]
MSIKSVLAVSALAVAAVVATGASAGAVPAPAPEPGTVVQTDVLPGIKYTASVVDNSVVLRTEAGSLTTQGSQFQVLDDQGRLVAGMPLTYLKDGMEWPIAARVEGNTATFTPSTDPAQARPAAMLETVADEPVDFNTALGTAATQFGLATAVGTLLGSLVGGVLGCVAGAIIGAPLVVPTFFAGPVGLCIAGAGVGITLGAAAGMIAIGVPVGVAAAIQFFNATQPR